MRRRLLLLSVLVATGAQAIDSEDAFDDPAVQERYRALLHSIRCMQCQNQSIADSPAETAGDLRRLVHDMIGQGKSDGEILDYLSSRYGDFIRYKPPFKPSTWLLWSAPGLFLVGGGIAFARILRNRMQQPLDEDLD
jgi:cytochrome c-type biogenesis protein CcmH